MKKIIEIKKEKGMFHLIFSDDQMILYPDIYYKHHIFEGMVINQKQYEEIKDDQDFLHYDQIGIKKLKKQMTKKEMESYFLSLNVSQKMMKQLIFSYEKKGYLNDDYYAESYIKQKSMIEGPNLIFEKLKEKGISTQIIVEKLKKIDEKEIMNHLMIKKVKTLKHKSKKQALQLLKQHFLMKGFNSDLIDQVIFNHQDLIKPDTLLDIERIFPKLINQLKRKYEGHQLKYHLKQKLYQKGFSNELIETFLMKKEKELS